MSIVPPEHLRGVGGRSQDSFLRVGRRWRRLLEEYGLEPTHDVLDAGCGSGRIAIPLTEFLTTGRYEGFDVSEEMVRWCQEHITPRYPNFRFQAADIYNRRYNPAGRMKARDFRFPYDDASFDFAYLTSVFTHMFPRDVAHYLEEVARVLRPGGRCVATYFLLNERSESAIRARRTQPPLRHRRRGYRFTSLRLPEMAVAHEEAAVRRMYEGAGLTVLRVAYGRWAGGDNPTRQDVILAMKQAHTTPTLDRSPSINR